MIDNLINLAKEVGGDYMRTDNGLDNKHVDESLNLAGGSIVDTLKQQISGGNLQGIMDMFGSNAANTAQGGVMQNAVLNYAGTIANKFGISSEAANNIAGNVIPMIMSKFVSKTNDPNDSSFDIQSIATSLLGDNAGGFDIQGLLGKFTGGNNNGGGNDLLGGLGNMAKGLFS